MTDETLAAMCGTESNNLLDLYHAIAGECIDSREKRWILSDISTLSERLGALGRRLQARRALEAAGGFTDHGAERTEERHFNNNTQHKENSRVRPKQLPHEALACVS